MAEHSATPATAQRSQLSQNQILLLFSGEAYNIEMGITNELFQIEREENQTCRFATVPNDVTQNVCTGPLAPRQTLRHALRRGPARSSASTLRSASAA